MRHCNSARNFGDDISSAKTVADISPYCTS